MSTMLPSPPKSLGMLGDVLTSALKSVLGEENGLELKPKKSVCVIMVDGLGLKNLRESAAHAGYLNSLESMTASCYFPSTTATSIVSFATGKPPEETGFIGYQIYDRSSSNSLNLLSGWNSTQQARDFQKLETLSEVATKSGVEFHVISPAVYEKSGFSAATMRSAIFHGHNSVAERFATAEKLLNQPGKKLIYLYVPELDQTAHAQGWQSDRWLQLLEDLDSEVSGLAKVMSESSGLILTADHGVLDIQKANHVYLDEVIRADELDFVGGDTRGLFLYLKDTGKVTEVSQNLSEHLGDRCYVLTPEQLVNAGYWKQGERELLLPEIVLLAKKEVALYHRDFAKKKSLEMIGHHGSISSTEMTIPLLRIGF